MLALNEIEFGLIVERIELIHLDAFQEIVVGDRFHSRVGKGQHLEQRFDFVRELLILLRLLNKFLYFF